MWGKQSYKNVIKTNWMCPNWSLKRQTFKLFSSFDNTGWRFDMFAFDLLASNKKSYFIFSLFFVSPNKVWIGDIMLIGKWGKGDHPGPNCQVVACDVTPSSANFFALKEFAAGCSCLNLKSIFKCCLHLSQDWSTFFLVYPHSLTYFWYLFPVEKLHNV